MNKYRSLARMFVYNVPRVAANRRRMSSYKESDLSEKGQLQLLAHCCMCISLFACPFCNEINIDRLRLQERRFQYSAVIAVRITQPASGQIGTPLADFLFTTEQAFAKPTPLSSDLECMGSSHHQP
jgi:hypothetical protein